MITTSSLLLLLLITSTAQAYSEWEGPYTMPLVPAAGANLPDGSILTWSAFRKYSFGGSGRTWTAIFDPNTKLSSSKLITTTNHDMFCPGTAVLPDNRIMITGGSNSARSTFYDPYTDAWTKGPRMNIPRGYHTMTVLPDGSVFTLGGSWSGGVGNKHGEVWSSSDGQWRKKSMVLSKGSILTNDRAGVYKSDNHMWFFTAPNEKVFHVGPSYQMHWIDLSGNGSITKSEKRGNLHTMNGNAMMYDIGMILALGGAENYSGGAPATKQAHVIDINDENNVKVDRVGDMSFPRVYCNSVVLPSGEVVVIGGQKIAVSFSDVQSNLIAELWNPNTRQFTQIAKMKTPRNYHSVALLMKDGRVWSGGGGLCGSCSANHPDAEILSPPYLFNPDGSLATRPVITSVGSAVSPGGRLEIKMDSEGPFTFALVRSSANTHSINTDLRRVPLQIKLTKGGGVFVLDIPANKAVALPGTYMIFAMNAAGVPSVSELVTIKEGVQSPPTPAPVVPATPAPVSAPTTTTTGMKCLDVSNVIKSIGSNYIGDGGQFVEGFQDSGLTGDEDVWEKYVELVPDTSTNNPLQHKTYLTIDIPPSIDISKIKNFKVSTNIKGESGSLSEQYWNIAIVNAADNTEMKIWDNIGKGGWAWSRIDGEMTPATGDNLDNYLDTTQANILRRGVVKLSVTLNSVVAADMTWPVLFDYVGFCVDGQPSTPIPTVSQCLNVETFESFVGSNYLGSGGQSVAGLVDDNLTGTDDEWKKYLELTPASTADNLKHESKFTVEIPNTVDVSKVVSFQLKTNFMGVYGSRAGQVWEIEILNTATNKNELVWDNVEQGGWVWSRIDGPLIAGNFESYYKTYPDNKKVVQLTLKSTSVVAPDSGLFEYIGLCIETASSLI